jgi:hypothetical protein
MSKLVLLRIPEPELVRLDTHVARVRGVRSKTILQAITDYLDRQDEIFKMIERNWKRKAR